MRYIISGSNGSIGKHLVRRLLSQGHYVEGMDNFSRSNKGFRIEDSCSTWDIDIAKPSMHTQRIFEGGQFDCCIHLAAINGTSNFYERAEEVIRVGVLGTSNIIYDCQRTGVKDLIIFSTSEVYGDHPPIPTAETAPLVIPNPLNPRYSYSAGKILSECLALNAKSFDKVMIVRPFNVIGSNMGKQHVVPEFIDRMKSLDGNQFQIQGTGDETRSFCWIEDFLDAFDIILNKGINRGIYNLGTDEEITIGNLAKLIATEFAREIEIIPGALAPGSPSRRCPDLTRIKALGYSPKTKIHQAIKSLVKEALEG